MITKIKTLLLSKSRFYFNIGFFKLLIKICNYWFNREENYKTLINLKLKKFFPNSNFFFFNHGRSGFYALLKSLKKNNRKKILINSLTLFEMINMVIYAGYEPIFVDNKERSFNSNTLSLLNKHSDQIKVVVVTHLNGINEEINEIKNRIDELNINLTLENKIILIEDCAVSFGAKNKFGYCGNLGDYSIISFNIMKNITCLTGGLLIDNTKKLDQKDILNDFVDVENLDLFKKTLFVLIIQFLNLRIIFPLFFLFIKFAIKYEINFFLKKYRTDFEITKKDQIPSDFLKKISNFQLYLLFDQFDDIDEKIKIRVKNSEYIYQKLKNNTNLVFPQKDFNQRNVFIDFPVLCKSYEYKNKIWSKSLIQSVDIKNYYYTNCKEQKIYNKFDSSNTNFSKEISNNIIMLPVHVNQNLQDLDILCKLFDEE